MQQFPVHLHDALNVLKKTKDFLSTNPKELENYQYNQYKKILEPEFRKAYIDKIEKILSSCTGSNKYVTFQNHATLSDDAQDEGLKGYVLSPFGTRVHLTPLFWEADTIGRVETIIHELSRLYAGNLGKDGKGGVDDAYLFSNLIITIYQKHCMPKTRARPD